MNRVWSTNVLRRGGFALCAAATGLLLSTAANADVDKTARIEASGEGALYDVKATGAGTLRVCTKAARAGDRWRASIAPKGRRNVGAPGTGSDTTFTGCISRLLVAGMEYVVLVTYDGPLPGGFPADVTVHFTGASDGTDPPLTGLDGTSLADVVARPTAYKEFAQGCPTDGSTIACGADFACAIDAPSDLDTFLFTVPANSLLSTEICGANNGAGITIFDATGAVVGGAGVLRLPAPGTYTIRVSGQPGGYALSMEGISPTYECALPIAFNQTRSGNLDTCADQDTFTFVCPTNRVIQLAIVGQNNGAGLALFDPSGVFVSSGGIFTCGTTGTYTVLVSATSGGFDLTLQWISGP